MTIAGIQNDIVEEFSMFDNWMERYEYMIELGKSLPIVDVKFKTDENIIRYNRNTTKPTKTILSIKIIAQACIAAIKASISVVIFFIVSEIFVLK